MSAFISGGVATFEQSRKLAEYENRKASISFNVTADAPNVDATATVEYAMTLAKNNVLRALGLEALAEVADKADKGSEPAKKGPGRPRKTAEPSTSPPSTPTSTASAPQSASTPASPPVSAIDPADIVPPARQISNGSEDRKDPADIDEFDDKAAVVPVTDAALKEACGAKAQAFVTAGNANGSQIIKDLISKKTGGPARYSEIPQAQRQAFLTELKAL